MFSTYVRYAVPKTRRYGKFKVSTVNNLCIYSITVILKILGEHVV